MFVDRVRIYARAGKGGRGCVSFLRELHRPHGGPDGGDGGRGADVILEVNPHRNNLNHLKHQPHHFAKNGQNGDSKQCTGKNAPNLIIEVPPGTVVSRLSGGTAPSTEEFDPTPEKLLPLPEHGEELEVLTDLMKPGERFMLCKGGDGGRGNRHFKSSTNQAPRQYENGWPGEFGQFVFELKSMADIGLVGYPNAGKSTLLGRLSKAHPKIGPYPFTTLTPMVGVIEFPDFFQISVADIPGLIEGASEGRGLGHDFLRHIERCRILLFVLDTSGQEGREPWEDFATLRKELKAYSPELAQRMCLVVANKMDLPAAQEKVKTLRKKVRRKMFEIAGGSEEDIEELKKILREMIEEGGG